MTSLAAAQSANTALPEAIYWRQNLLTVPYQWSSTSGSTPAKSVWLYVSKDRGANWQPVGDAKPNLLAFNYRAEADGEYWFAIRTTDANQRDVHPPTAPGPNGSLVPELRVIVDTSMPRIETLTSEFRDASTLEVRWRASDPNLGAHSCNVEVQTRPDAPWQPVPLRTASEVSPGVWEGSANIAVTGELPTAARATVIDLAGNRAVFQSPIAAPADSLVGSGVKRLPNPDGSTTASRPAGEPGWVSTSAPPLQFASTAPAEPQVWSADRTARAPFGASESEASVAYAAPVTAGPAAAQAGESPRYQEIPEPTTEDRPLGNVPLASDPELDVKSPFREASLSHAKGRPGTPAAVENNHLPLPSVGPLNRLVNSKTFELEYELAGLDSAGVAKIELWGTRDGGKTWRSYAVDDDNRSPLQVTVDEEGEYGFSIVAVAAGELRGTPPHPGDTPETWVKVDLQPPMARIQSVDASRNDLEGELTIHWQADDDNLEARPISLFYSSRPAGPWTPIATNLENTGEFHWPVERHVPRRIYLKLEARDTAGNVAVYQTSEPVLVEREPVVANWQRLPPVE